MLLLKMEKTMNYPEDDFMELGDSGLVALGQGWLMDPKTGNKRSPEGNVFNRFGELIAKGEFNIEEDQ